MDANLDPIKELEAMKTVAEALKDLEEGSVRRVLSWATDHFSVSPAAPAKVTLTETVDSEEDPNGNGVPNFGDVAELFAEANPATDAHKALVVAYWVQYMEGAEGVDAQIVNTKLKHIGYGVTNITRAFESLKKTKPQLIVQLRKSGQTKQARKTFKVTSAGKSFVEELLKKGDA